MNFLGFNSIVLSVVSDVPVDNETSVVTLSILRIYRPIFEDAHRGTVCVRAFIGVSVRVL